MLYYQTLIFITSFPNMVFFFAGLYSRGKSHALHLSIPIEHLLTFWNAMEAKEHTELKEGADDTDDTGVILSQVHSQISEPEEGGSQESVCGSYEDNVEDSAKISAQAINIASSIVGSCLAQLCEWTFWIKCQ